ncbi:Na+/H+ antiporter subunit E [Saccharospirillum mangrovi]|uniref:Na+/H+ antiporter subunit E n=1 Tax=Saccharospirillum mangrovi TaxID=2161747 RepID=UPI000D3665E7|nr:Na+/H+ antiporter subunit E [Saccharospirillum mangrovi]
MRRLIPHPYLSLILFVVWLLLSNSIVPGHIVLAAVFAVVIPLLTAPLQNPHPPLKKPLLAARYVLMLMWDIVVSNVEVAIQVLGPLRKLNPGFIVIPLDTREDLPITLLASSISLTPGTVSVEVAKDRSHLYVHVLNLDDEAKTVAAIKQRYEKPLKEIFGC